MDENRKYGKKEETRNPQIRGETEYNLPPYGINENVPEGFTYPHWMPQNMNYAFDQQYNYYSHVPQFHNTGMIPQGFVQDQTHPIMFEKPRGKSHGKKKIKLEYISGKNKRSVCFSKRKRGIMKKAYELNILTGTEILLLVASESGHVFTFATDKLKPIITEHEDIIQNCLNRPEGMPYKPNFPKERPNPEDKGYPKAEAPNEFRERQ
ncbi:MADS domain-containing protein [Encephalitozoon intestinalis ATCC 50506]|uniref:MADS domain-containing protein n=1 Tax=Encephalitozoon intestinalis (strain ATCC 50506) TaxID=876142 RepID=E0S895_ENCIT|nr:MADS domain-containing protein [Encephalitozoon intestinalis ATCC 50506]ADM11930.1 MADS domain-containing protein [Encephalitozoon intestinalis ATCC 50506]UTX45688.1 MADS domain-containing protein [Encephalitozoon intestinalis]